MGPSKATKEKKYNIGVFSDNARTKKTAKECCESAQQKMFAAESTVDFFNVMKMHTPGLVILDSPSAEEGVELLQWLKGFHPRTDVIFVSQIHDSSVERRVRSAGVLSYISRQDDETDLENYLLSLITSWIDNNLMA